MDLICQDSSLGFISKTICKKHSRHEDCVELCSWQICLQLLPQNKWIILRIVFFKCWLFFCHWNLQCQLVRALFTLKIIERWGFLMPPGTVWLVWLGKKNDTGKMRGNSMLRQMDQHKAAFIYLFFEIFVLMWASCLETGEQLRGWSRCGWLFSAEVGTLWAHNAPWPCCCSYPSERPTESMTSSYPAGVWAFWRQIQVESRERNDRIKC